MFSEVISLTCRDISTLLVIFDMLSHLGFRVELSLDSYNVYGIFPLGFADLWFWMIFLTTVIQSLNLQKFFSLAAVQMGGLHLCNCPFLFDDYMCFSDTFLILVETISFVWQISCFSFRLSTQIMLVQKSCLLTMVFLLYFWHLESLIMVEILLGVGM